MQLKKYVTYDKVDGKVQAVFDTEQQAIEEARVCGLYWVAVDYFPEVDKDSCSKSPTGKHKFVMSADSFERPYCKYCYKDS